ncbi:MAG: hypothetical protein ACC682_08465 [Gemmatimonadota bacterium]
MDCRAGSLRRGRLICSGVAATLYLAPGLRAQSAEARLGTAPADTAHVVLGGNVTTVELRVPSVIGVVEAYAIRLPGQTLSLTEVRGAAGPIEYTLIDERGALRIAVASSADITVRYRVEGDRERIPLFVPGGGAEVTVARELEEPYLIRLTGDTGTLAGIDTETSMPRFRRLSDGTLEVRLSSLPSFIRLSGGGPLSFARLADVAALLLIALGALLAYRKIRS